MPRALATAAMSASAGSWVKPTTRKLERCTSSSGAGAFGDRALVVVGVGAVDRTYLDECRAALSEDVRYAEASADLARLAA